MSFQIENWLDISEQFNETILLGNGASISIDQNFCYSSLKQHAIENGLLTEHVQRLFDYFETDDFELILRLVWQASKVNIALQIKDNATQDAYLHVRECLIQSVRSISPDYSDVEDQFENITNFLKPFKTILSLNYDLSLYWVIMYANRTRDGHTFKDCFVHGTFDDDWQRFRSSISQFDRQISLVFYPHGSLMLARNILEHETKLEAHGSDLLTQILREWESSNYVPLFVSEGTSEQKVQSIQSSNYLNTVYREVLPQTGSNLTIYGWGFGEHDIHILKKLGKGEIERVAVSVFNKDQGYCARVHQMLKDHLGADIQVTFFDCLSPAVWNKTA